MSVPAMAGQEAAPAPIITDVTYRNYDGPLKTHAVRWWVVALATIRASVNKSRYGYWIPAGIIVIANLILGIGFYIAQNVRASQGVMSTLFGDDTNYYATTLYQSLGWSSHPRRAARASKIEIFERYFQKHQAGKRLLHRPRGRHAQRRRGSTAQRER